MEFLFERQRQQRKTCCLLDGTETGLQTPFAAGRHDKPQVVAMFALIVVIDLGKPIDRRGNRCQLFWRNGHGRERRGSDAFRGEDGTDARNLAFAAQVFEAAENDFFADPKARRQLGERSRHQRKIALEVVEQLEVEAAAVHGQSVHQKPMRTAREVKKMPDGLSAGISPSLAKFSVL